MTRLSEVIPDSAQRDFWKIVNRCLVVFHLHQSEGTYERLLELRRKLLAAPLEEYELFFHSEPFDVACALAQHPLRVGEHQAEYLQIRDGKK